MNQNARQKTETPVGRDFYKLMNNVNFGIDCRNNIDNCKFEAIYDETGEVSCIKKYVNIFGNEKYKDFACIKTIQEEMEQTINEKLLTLDPNEPTFGARKYWINIERAENLDVLESMNEHKKKKKIENIFFLTLKKKNSKYHKI